MLPKNFIKTYFDFTNSKLAPELRLKNISSENKNKVSDKPLIYLNKTFGFVLEKPKSKRQLKFKFHNYNYFLF